MALSTAYRLDNKGVTIDGGQRVDFKRYPFVPAIIDARARRITIIKSAQMGISVACVLKALEGARAGGLRGILYGFPSDREVQDFSKARLAPILSANSHVWGDSIGDAESAGLRQIGNTFLYFRGVGQKGASPSKSLSPIKSIPVDWLFLDERDEMDDARVDEAEHRLDGSLRPEQTALSTPTLPGYGVDIDYKSSNQSAWQWKCPLCNGWTCLEDTYPDCIAEPVDGDAHYLCAKCRKPLQKVYGEWIARVPHITDHKGFWISQLCSPTKTANDILLAADQAIKRGRMRAFYNQTLGRPYAEVEDQITEEQLTALVRDEPRPINHEGPCAMGVDPGKPHWYEVRVRTTDVDSKQVARGRADTYEELSAIAKRYNVESGVMDQGFDPSAVSRFVRDHNGWFGALYVNAKKGDPDWDQAEHLVKVGRTRLLDDAHHEIVAKRVSYYQRDEFWHECFVPQMTNLKRATIENKINGQRDAVWVVTGGRKQDHLRHAGAYAHLAMQRVGIAKSMQRAYGAARDEHRGVARPRSWMVA
jgi:hypothetical protein